MTRRRRPQPTSALLVALIAALVALVSTAVGGPASGQAGAPVGFTDGRWVGSFSYLGTNELGGVPVRYRATGTFELVSSGGGTTGLWDMYLTSLIEGGVASADAGGSAEGEGILDVTLTLDEVIAKDAATGLEVTFTGEELPDSGAGTLTADSTACHSLSGTWEVPFTGSILEGSFVANRSVGGSAGPLQALQQAGLDLLVRIDEGEVPIDAIRVYLHDAELVMGDTTERSDTCDADTYHRFSTAALALGDTMIGALTTRIDDLTDDELVEVVRMGWRSGAFQSRDLAFPYETALDQRMTTALADGNLEGMRYWLPVASEYGRDVIARNLEAAIEEAR